MRAIAGFNVVLLVVCFLMAPALQQEQEDPDINAYQDPSLGALARFLIGQLAAAKETDPIPNGVFPFGAPNAPTYRLKRCKRADVAKCVNPGNSTNGLPFNLQGSYWMDGLQKTWDEELASTYGPFDQKKRLLTIQTWAPRAWGVHDTSARKAPGQWYNLPAGASHINALHTVHATANLFLNEDLTFGQIGATLALWGVIPIDSPTWFLDFSMRQLPDGVSWDRKSFLLGIPLTAQNYVLRQVVRGDLSRGKYFDEWLKALDGRDYFYLDNP